MNVLYLSTWCPFPPDNGSRIRAYYLLEALARAHRVTLVAFDPDPETEFTAPQNVTVHLVSADPFRYVLLPQAMKYLSPVPLIFWRIKEMETALEQLRQREVWDVIVAVQAPVARYALQCADAPRLLDVDTALSWQLHRRYREQGTHIGRWRTWVSWYKAYRYERALFRRFHTCAVASPLEVPSIRAMLGAQTQVAVIPNGVDLSHNRPELGKPRTNTLIYNGALTYSANYDAMQWFLAEIHPRIRAKVSDASLSITGSTKGVNLAGLRLDASVQLTGYVTDVSLLVAEAAVCVVPIREGGGTRLKILEAMALGTPVVATSKGAEGLDVVDGEHLLVADTPASFADAVLRVMSDSALRERLRHNARALVEAWYDWEAIGARFVGLVEAAASGKWPDRQRPSERPGK